MGRKGEGRRLQVGDVVAPRELVTMTGAVVRTADSLVHLQFRRFAGCPVCNLHLRSVARRHDELRAAGVREVVVFHSTADELRRYEGDLPFAVVADPGKRLYREFGVEASPWGMLRLRAWPPIIRAVSNGVLELLRGRPVPPLRPRGGRYGLPADFLLDADGRVRACHYGAHVDDQWSVDEILTLARGAWSEPAALAG